MATFRSFAATRPLSVAAVGLAVRDLAGVAAFYRDAIGLSQTGGSGDRLLLGNDGETLVELIHRPEWAQPDKGEAGLFHTAFLMPDRAALGRFLVRHIHAGRGLEGASDHIVSEALYLSDPEGNGIEVYRDRNPSDWVWQDGEVAMATNRLDLGSLAAEPDAGGLPDRDGAPAGMHIGHVHLKIGDVGAAEGAYRDLLGLQAVAHYPGATFMASGGYHHHVGLNEWQSPGAGRRDSGRLGLAYVAFSADREVVERLAANEAWRQDDAGFIASDPWGTELRLRTRD